MSTVSTTVTTAEAHHALNVDADPTHLVPLQNAALHVLQHNFPGNGVTAVKAEIMAGGKAVKFTVTYSHHLLNADVIKPFLR
jgi:hypothetical protein